MSFEQEIVASSHRLKNQDEIVAYFQKEYPGRKVQKNGRVIEEWRGKLADALLPFAKDKNGQPLKRASLLRRFQGGRETSKRKDTTKAEFKQLGATLPVQAPEGGYHVWGRVCLRYSEGCEEREIDEIVTGEAAEALAKGASVQVVINQYNRDDWDAEEPTSTECADDGCTPELHVEAIDEEIDEDIE